VAFLRVPLVALVPACAIACARGGTSAAPPLASTSTDADSGAEDTGQEGEGDEFAPAAPILHESLLEEAERELGTMRSSRYVHRTDVDESAGRFDYDCSGFVGYALSRAAPSAYGAVRAYAGRRPLAKHYVAWLDSGTAGAPWTRVPNVPNLQAGDVIAWLKPAALTSHNTGHVMVVAAPPHPRSEQEWVVPIFDSSASSHGEGDSRRAQRASGLGRGTIVLVVDGTGLPTAYRWSEGARSALLETHIVLGRIAAP
jgi:hypothetical protein